MADISLLIIVKDRRAHLDNLLKALPASSYQPAEVVIVHMNEAAYQLTANYQLHELTINTTEPLPLAKARNTAAKSARYQQLIFLDVDCIPSPDCFKTLIEDMKDWRISMVDPRYLNQPIRGALIDFNSLQANSRPNSARTLISYGRTDDYALFWSLGFAITKADFELIGGFDEGYVGYGGEDTDFALMAQQAGISLGFSRAIVYHQYHPSYDPPLNWLADIVSNANYFYQKWRVWPMTGWLQQFADLGFINWQDNQLTLVRLPTDADVQAHRKISQIG